MQWQSLTKSAQGAWRAMGELFTSSSPLDNAISQKQASIQPYWVVVVIACAILIARQPERLFNAQFILEDGKVFFADAYNLTPPDAIFKPYQGYYHLIPRLIAEISSLFPLWLVPSLYTFSTLLLTAISTSWFYLPSFRRLVRSDALRLWVVLAILLSPNLEAIMLLAYIQWPLALWALLVTVMPVPENRWLAWGITLGYILVIATAPVLVVLLPIWLLRLLPAVTRWQRPYAGAIVLAHTIVLTLFLLNPDPTKVPSADLQIALLDLARAFVYKVIAFTVVGTTVTEFIVAHWGWPMLVGLALVVLTLSLLSLRRQHNWHKVIVSLLLVYVMIASSLLYFLRTDDFNFMFVKLEGPLLRINARYFFLASIAFYLLLTLQLDTFLSGKRLTLSKTTIVALYLLPVLLYLPTFRQPSWGNANWQQYASALANLPAQPPSYRLSPLALAKTSDRDFGYTLFLPLVAVNNQAQPPQTIAMKIPILPQGWFMTLYYPANSNAVYHFPEGVTFMGLTQQLDKDVLQLDLFWYGDTLVNGDQETRYTAYVHLVDHRQTRLAGSDVLLEPADKTPLLVFSSHHEIALPPDFSWDSHSLIIGLYHFQDEHLINGSSVLVELR